MANPPDHPDRSRPSFSFERPLLCLVTDRRRLAAAEGSSRAAVVELARAAADAGIHLFQIRENDLEARDLELLVRAVVAATASSTMRILVNERVDVAIAAEAHGVHLRAASVASDRARSMTPPGFIVGRSVHTADEASIESARGAADYLIVGTVFPSSSKPDWKTCLGTDELARAARISQVPVLAIGGVDRSTLALVAGSGADGLAAITFFVPDTERPSLRPAVELVQRAFDTSGSDL